jgi:hemerythrin
METMQYPGMESHVASHDSFFKKLCELIARFERGEDKFHTRIAAYVGTYLFNHVDTCDRALADWQHQTSAASGETKV